MDEDEVRRLLKHQDGVISRRQVIGAEGDDNDIETRLRRRVWARVHPGVYVDHTGPLSFDQRCWAAVLVHAPAAVNGRAALVLQGLQDEVPPVVEVVVARGRSVVDPPGVRSVRSRRFDEIAQLTRSPPRVSVEYSVLVAASVAPTEDRAVAVLGQACQRGRTTAARLVAALARLPRLSRRQLLLEVLDDVAHGALSALERRYLVDVERLHGLPTAGRQVRAVSRAGVTYRDVDYRDQRTLVELDGRIGHDPAETRWADLERDLMATVVGDLTLRCGWRQVLEPCRLAGVVGSVLAARGWDGAAEPCGPDCDLDRGGSPAAGAGDPPRSAA